MKLLKFYAPWCNPCTSLSTLMDSMSLEIEIPIESIDIDKNPEIAAKYQIRSLPTLIIEDNSGVIINRSTGIKTKAQLLDFLKTSKIS